jgi:hypothetical protein
VPALFQILSHDSLRILSEDSLHLFISSRLYADPEYIDLFQFIRFEYLSLEWLSTFLSIIPNSIDSHLWGAVSSGLMRGLVLAKFNSLDGIISHRTRRHGGNVHDKGIVTITSKSFLVRAMRNVADLTSDSRFGSGSEPGQ